VSELLGKKGNKKEVLKDLIKRLHKGEDPEKIKKEFKEILGDVTPVDVSQIESELIKEGMPREEIQKLCDVHLSVLRESLEKEDILAPEGHPIHTLMKEHEIVLKFANEMKDVAKVLMEAKDYEFVNEEISHIEHIKEHFQESESHYQREENVLFPFLEKHGVTEPPAVMWIEHNKIRDLKKKLYKIVDMHDDMSVQDFGKHLREASIELVEMLSGHFYKENKILFPTALRVIEENEWKEIRRQFDELGYCCFTPEVPEIAVEEPEVSEAEIKEGKVTFAIGELSIKEIEAIFNTLPVDITFIDKDDTVQYFSQSKERIFVRTKAVIGRKVQQCHPEKSIHIVNKILEDFKNHRKDMAEFWINYQGKYVYIRYFPVRDKDGNYLGCLEVTQDVSDIQKIKGEKRLL